MWLLGFYVGHNESISERKQPARIEYHTNTIMVPIEQATVDLTISNASQSNITVSFPGNYVAEGYITNFVYIPRLDVQTQHWGQEGEPSWIVMRDTVTHSDYLLVWTKGTAVSVTKLEGQ